jgi:hypothetical protein
MWCRSLKCSLHARTALASHAPVHDPFGIAVGVPCAHSTPNCFGCFLPAGEGGMSQEEKAKMVLDDLADRLPEQYDMEDIRSRVDEVTPYVMVAIQVRAVGAVMMFQHYFW